MEFNLFFLLLHQIIIAIINNNWVRRYGQIQ